LSNAAGRILYDGGVGKELDLPALVSTITQSMQASFLLADQLESPEPFTIQYQAGQKYDLYLANLGLEYFLSIFFDSQVRRGRLGTIWVFAQRAINDLQGLLLVQEAAVFDSGMKPVKTAQPPVVEKKPTPPPTPVAKEKARVEPEPAPVEVVEEVAEVIPEEPEEEVEPLSLAEIQAFLGIEEPENVEAVDLDSFWDEALEESDDSGAGTGMSWEEAQKRGLISTEFDSKDRPKKSD
jgi:hypothetical protein